VALDEFWFHDTAAHEWIWLPTDEKTPEIERQTVQSKQLILTIVWNRNRFYLIDVLPNGCKFNASYSMNNVLDTVLEWRQGQRGGVARRLVVHADNARRYTTVISASLMEENGMSMADYPPYSPNLIPSDFYLFGYAKSRLGKIPFDDGGELFSAVEAILGYIEKSTFDILGGLCSRDRRF
jgi:hypothetical protein